MSTICTLFTLLAVLLYKYILKKNSKVDFTFYPWLLVPLSTLLPFININIFPEVTQPGISYTDKLGSLKGVINNSINKDFAVSVTKSSIISIDNLFYIVWIIGGFLFLCIYLKAFLKLNVILNESKVLSTDHYLNRYMFKYRNRKIPIKIVVSNQLHQPVTFWNKQHIILLPSVFLEDLNQDELQYILLHELIHIDKNDIFKLYSMTLFQILFWFNPVSHLTKKMALLDCELNCDYQIVSESQLVNSKSYGHTLIKCSTKFKEYRFLPVINFISSKYTLHKRIKLIVSSKKLSQPHYWIKFGGIGSVILILCVLAPFMQITYASNSTQDLYAPKNLKYSSINLDKYFKDVSGSMVIYDIKHNQYYVYNEQQAFKRISPDSTYKIFDSLIHLKEKTITLQDNELQWNHENTPFDEWNRDQTLQTALKYSVNWYFQRLDSQIDLSTINKYLKEYHYGNENISGGLDNYWLESSLKVSPIEQVDFLKNFYHPTGSFRTQDFDFIKSNLKISTSQSENLWGKTGTGIINHQSVNGWFIGGLEFSEGNYIFATYINGKDNITGVKAKQITQRVLNDRLRPK